MSELEKQRLTNYLRDMNEEEMEYVVSIIPIELLLYGATRQADEMRAQLVGHEQIVKGQVCTYGHGQ